MIALLLLVVPSLGYRLREGVAVRSPRQGVVRACAIGGADDGKLLPTKVAHDAGAGDEGRSAPLRLIDPWNNASARRRARVRADPRRPGADPRLPATAAATISATIGAATAAIRAASIATAAAATAAATIGATIGAVSAHHCSGPADRFQELASGR